MSSDLRGGNGRRKHLTGGEFSRFLDATYDAPPEQRSLCFVLAHTGCQVEEVIALTAPDIDLAGDAVLFRAKKGHERAVPVPHDLMVMLDAIHGIEWAQGRKGAGQSRKLWGIDRSTASRWVCRIMREAGIDGPQAGPRGLRNRFALEKQREGYASEVVQRWLGNKVAKPVD